MNFNKFTIKSQEAVQNAQEIASSYSNQIIEPEHLLAALVQDSEGVVVPLLHKLGGPSRRKPVRRHPARRLARRFAEKELANLEGAGDDEEVKKRLKGLGYIS